MMTDQTVDQQPPKGGRFKGLFLKMQRYHIHDWGVLVILGVLALIFHIVPPYKRFVSRYDIDDYMYPMKKATVPIPAVGVVAVGAPMLCILIHYAYKRDLHELHHAILALIFSLLLTAIITESAKNALGFPRPDFFWRCFPDGKAVYKEPSGEVACTGSKSEMKEAYRSFPSGHTAWAFAGLGYLSYYLAGKLQLFYRPGRVAKLVIVLIPILGAAVIGIYAVDDYWHHWYDALTAAIIGLVVAFICYRQHFPPLSHAHSMNAYPSMGLLPSHVDDGRNGQFSHV